MKDVLIKRNEKVQEVPFAEIKEGDIVYLDGYVSDNFVTASTDCYECGDADFEGQYHFWIDEENDFWEEDIKESMLELLGTEPPMKVWCRVGCTLHLSKKDADVLFGPDKNAAQEILSSLVQSQPLERDGECYIPGSCVGEFNRTYGTNYPEEDVDA